MSTTYYDDFVADVRAWVNRDSDVLPDAVIDDAIYYAADKAYKVIKTPALEASVNYTIVAPGTITTSAYQVTTTTAPNGLSMVTLPVPADLTFFIALRLRGQNDDKNILFNEKADIRTFYDMYADRYSDFIWSRREGSIVASGTFGENDVIELLYYRRLPSFRTRYPVNAANFNAGLVNPQAAALTTAANSLFFAGSGVTLPGGGTGATPYPPIAGTHTAYDTQDATNSRVQFFFDDGDAIEPDNWLRDTNRQIVLFGAIQQCYDYLDDDVQANKYKMKFAEAIQEINDEENQRRASGGNIQMHFNSQLI